jgi:RNA polymerase sigma-70 factor (ECF subfamily)
MGGTMATIRPAGGDLDGYRSYLRLLARAQLDDRVQQRVDASDIVQETLLEAHRSREAFSGESPAELMAWLRRILARRLAHAFRDHTRQRRDVRRQRSLEASLDASSAGLEQILAGEVSSPSQRVMAAERVQQLADALESLTPEQREAIIQHYFRGRTVPQIAATMLKSEAAVGGLLHRGMQALRSRLNPPGSSVAGATT